jgi:hypothetical protein
VNGKQAKAIRRRAKQMMVEWYKTLLPEEEQEKVTEELVLEQIPQGYHRSMGKVFYSAYSLDWFIKAEKLKFKHGTA